MKLALAVIIKDEVDQAIRIVSKYGDYFDALYFAVDDKIDEFKKTIGLDHKVVIVPYEWRDDFAHKRNFLAEKIREDGFDYYFRIDADDAIEGVENIRRVAEKAYDNNISIVYCYYNYAKDEWGNTIAAHYRETIIKCDTNLFWNKPIHENILPKSKAGFKVVLDDTIQIDHIVDEEHAYKSALRNIRYLLKEYDRDKENTDPRTLAYLGRMLMGIGEFDKAVFFLEKHIEKSGWDEDRYMSWCQLAEIMKQKGNLKQATACAFEALAERPDFPDAYLKLHDIYFEQQKWEKAIEWGKQGLMRKPPKTFVLLDPSSYTWRPALSMAYCYFQLGQFEEAKRLFDVAAKAVPTLDFVVKNKKLFEDAVYHKRFVEKLLWLLNFIKEKDKSKIRYLLEAVPDELNENEVIIKLKNTYLPPKVWNNKSIVVFCGNTPEAWSPKSIDKGIGGSEEAVIYLTKEFAKLGYQPTVYCNCGDDEGEYDGVKYLNWYRFNRNDEFNIFISWRTNVFPLGVKAKKSIIWLHDMPQPELLEEDLIKQVDHIVVLSQYHKSLLPRGIPEEKIFVSTNGIVPEHFERLWEEKREPHRVIYASSYDRGLEDLLKIWGDVKKEVPDAELHIFYGWNTFDKYVKMGYRDNSFKEKMLELMKQDGVYEHGRVGHKQLLKEYAKSKVFAYPTNFAGEINCIALTKAIACGCVPITNNKYVLGERNPLAVPDEKFKDNLIRALKGEITHLINTDEYIKANSWEAVAGEWHKHLFNKEIDVIYRNRFEWIRSYCSPEQKIVDIGCAGGVIFDGWDRKNITSVDIDVYDMPNFVRANAESLPFKDKSFEVAVLGEVLEHLDDPVKALKEAGRVADKVVITVPYEYEWVSHLLPFKGVGEKEALSGKSREQLAKEASPNVVKFYDNDNLEHLWHKRFYKPETLAKDIEKAGFKNYSIVKIRNGVWSFLGAVIDV